MIKKYPNVVITRSFSKIYALAGLRIGYGLASKNITQKINDKRQPFNVNYIAQSMAAISLNDKKFVKDLLSKVVKNDKTNSQLISDKTKNWDVERIAMVDILLMKLALTELLHFNSVPVKVTLNEYIELSKWYSTPKSKVFVNGVLDKLVLELTEKGELKKMGRGLLES